jgi:Tfp pilus assembly protein FimT
MPNRFHPRPRGVAVAEMMVFAAIVAFLGAIVLPGAHRTPAHAKAAAVIRHLRTTQGLTAAADDQRPIDDEASDAGLVLLRYSPR